MWPQQLPRRIESTLNHRPGLTILTSGPYRLQQFSEPSLVHESGDLFGNGYYVPVIFLLFLAHLVCEILQAGAK